MSKPTTGVPESPTETIRVRDLTEGDAVIIPMVGNVEIVTSVADGLVSTDGTGSDSAYLWNADDPIDVISRAAS